LVFNKAFNLHIDIKTELFGIDAQQISELNLLDKSQNKEGITTYKWQLELLTGRIELSSEGYTQIVRQQPMFTNFQQLSQKQRGGTSFSKQPVE